MHFDFAHAAVAAILIYLTVWVLRKIGIVTEQERGHFQWNWKLFGAIFLVMFVFNIIWPYN
ncbi:hypothetical protein ACFL0S_08790 [Thermodesulfobacteriota bacterium]